MAYELDEGELPVAEDGSVEVPMDEEEAPAPWPPPYDEDEPNLVPLFDASEEGKKFLRELSDCVKTDFDTDFEGSKKRRDKIRKNLQIFAGELPKKTKPWKDAANAHVPSMLEQMSRICARVESEVCGDWTNVVQVLPVGPGDEKVAQLLTLHANWKIREKLPDFRRQVSRAIMMFFVVGDVTCHSYFDEETGLNRHEMLTPDEFIVPYVYTTTMPDYGDLPHYTKVMQMYRHSLERKKGIWHGVEDVLDGKAPAYGDDPETDIRDEREKQEGIEKPDGQNAKNAPFKILWYEGWYDIPGQDRQRWCRVIQDYATGAVLSLNIHEEPNWEEKARFERQQSELDMYRQATEMRMQTEGVVAQAQESMNLLNPFDPVLPEVQAQLQQGQMALEQPPPVPPPWVPLNRDPMDPEVLPDRPRRDPVRMFRHGVCIEPIAGNIGLSVGQIIADLNRAQDTALSQYTDAATLNNVSAAFVKEGFEVAKDQEFSPGAFIKVQGLMGGTLQENIMMVPTKPPEQSLLELVKTFNNFAESVAQSPSVLSGEAGKSGETFRGISARIEQATKQLSVPGRHFCEFLRGIMQNEARLNAEYMEDEEIFYVTNHMEGAEQELSVGRHMYERNYRVSVVTDLRFATQAQRISEADELVMLRKAIPELTGNSYFQYYTLTKALQARNRADVIKALGQPPEGPPPFALSLPPPPPGMPPGPGGLPPGAPQGRTVNPNASQRPPGVPGPSGPPS